MSNKTKAVFCMLISALGFTFMSVTVKYVTGIPLFEKVFFRNLISLGVAFFMLKKSSAPMFGRRENQLALLARSIFGLAGVVLNFYAIANLTLADSSMLGKLSPIFVTIMRENQLALLARSIFGLAGVVLNFYAIANLTLADSSMLGKLSPIFVTIMACIFLKEKIDNKQILSIIITFLGALLVIKPEFSLEMLPSLSGIMSAASAGFLKEKIDNKQILSIIITFLGALLVIKPEFSLEMLPSLSGIMSAASAGIAYTLLRYLKDKESPDTIIFYFSLISVVFTAPFALAEYVQPTFTQLGLLLATGVFASVGQFGITYAYKFAKATEVSIYNYSAIVFGIILGFIFFGEIPDTLSLLGGAIIIAVAFYIFKHNQKK